jgi:hypothetical protein
VNATFDIFFIDAVTNLFGKMRCLRWTMPWHEYNNSAQPTQVNISSGLRKRASRCR